MFKKSKEINHLYILEKMFLLHSMRVSILGVRCSYISLGLGMELFRRWHFSSVNDWIPISCSLLQRLSGLINYLYGVLIGQRIALGKIPRACYSGDYRFLKANKYD